MANETTYEVYTLANGRWILDTRFKKSQRERAIDEGKQLAKQSGIEAVKVVREVYDGNDNLIKETTVYNSQKKENEGGGGGGFSHEDLAAPSYNVPGFEDLEAQQEFKDPSEDQGDEDGGRLARGGIFGRRKRGASADAAPQSDSATAATAVSPRRTGFRRPELMLIYKMFIIGAVSFVFAAFTTFIYAANFS